MRPQSGFHNGAIMRGDYKISKKGNNNTTAGFNLYNIITDPGETTDIRATEPNGEQLVNDMITEGVVWVSEFQDVTPCWFDNDNGGNGHPHSFLWNDGTLPNYNGFFGMPLIQQADLIKITGVNGAVEGITNGLFTVSLPTGINADQDIEVMYSVSGEAATDGSDYTSLTGVLTILEGTNSTDIIVIASEDGLAEISETVIIELTSTSIGLINTTPAEINISDVTVPSTLTAGDVAIVGYKAASGNIGELAFVMLKDISEGTSLSFSNRGWHSDGSFNIGGGGSAFGIDDVFSWTSSETYVAGTILKLGRNGKVSTVIAGVETEVGNTVQTFGTDGDWDLSPAGDSVLIYQGDTATHPADGNSAWITGLNTNGIATAAGWAVGGGNAYCELPTPLASLNIDVTGGDYTLNLSDMDYGTYIGNATGNVATIRASINNYQNWALSESNVYFLWNSNDTVEGNDGNIILEQITLSANHFDNSDFSIKIFPNPTTDYINLNSKQHFNKIEIELLTISGKSIKKVSSSSNKMPRINTSNLNSGMYFLRIKADNNLTIKKVIKL